MFAIDLQLIGLFIYLGFYVAFNTVQVISRRVVGRAEETSTYSLLGFCTVNCRPMAAVDWIQWVLLGWKILDHSEQKEKLEDRFIVPPRAVPLIEGKRVTHTSSGKSFQILGASKAKLGPKCLTDLESAECNG